MPEIGGRDADCRRARVRAGVVATVAAAVAYVVATVIEMLVVAQSAPSETELMWISDAILGIFVGVVVFLWLDLRLTRATLLRLERDQIVLDTQFSVAADIQRRLLPLLPADGASVRWAARLVPAGRIGGDLYDFIQSGHSWLMLVGDVSGKGIPAALLLASIRTMFRMMADDTHDPGELVTRISKRLYEDHGGTPYLTCVLVRLDVDARELEYVNAGHPTGIMLDGVEHRGAPWLLASTGPPAGLFPAQSYRAQSLRLPKHAVSVLVTDGITEAFEEMGLYGDPVATLLAQMPDPLVPARICDLLIERTAPAASGEWQDDRTVVAFALDAS